MPAYMKLGGVDGESGYTVRMKDLLVSSYQTGGSANSADSFDFKAEEGEDAVLIALLLPAVQKVREAAARFEPEPLDDFAATEDGGAVALTGSWGMAHYQYANGGDYDAAADDVIVDGNIITAENYDSVY